MASNSAAVENEGIFPDWVELYNTSASTLDLSDWSLSDSLASPRKFVFPPGTTVGPFSYLMVWCDALVGAPGLHTGFSLSGTTDDVTLYRSTALGGGAADTVAFGLQITDLTIGRVPNGSGAFTLNTPSPAAANTPLPLGVQDALKVNEIMADPSGGDDWFEMYNSGTNYIQFGGLIWSDRTNIPATNRPIPGLSFVAPGAFIQFFADNLQSRDADQTDFRLSANGEAIALFRTNGMNLIDSVSFGPQTNGIAYGRLPDGGTNLVFFPSGRSTPAASNFQLLTDIIINEVLTHTDAPLEDAIELYNPTPNPVDISYFWLSNSKDDPKKFRIPPGTVVPPFGFKVFYEFPGNSNGFNFNGQGTNRSFTLNSARGDQVFLHSATNNANGDLTYYRVSRDFGPAENGVAFGRYITSEGKTDFVAMSTNTFGVSNPSSLPQFRTGAGAANAYPKIGPVIINEIMYHPPEVDAGGGVLVDNLLDEYIELFNVSSTDRPLYDPAAVTNTWRIRGDVDFNFPQFVSMPRGAHVLVVNFDPATNAAQLAAFRSKYKVPAAAPIFGPYKGKLSNSGGSVELYKPDPPQTRPPDTGLVPYVLVDRVKFDDALPWPAPPDGSGPALQRVRPELYGNDPINWIAASPSPGSPQPPRIDFVQRTNSQTIIRFTGLANVGYTLEQRAALPSGASTNWARVGDAPPQSTTGVRQIPDNTGATTRFYRLVTPMRP